MSGFLTRGSVVRIWERKCQDLTNSEMTKESLLEATYLINGGDQEMVISDFRRF